VTRTGTATAPGTAESAAITRALHARLARPPILDDTWAIQLLGPEDRARVLAARTEHDVQVTPGFDSAPIFAGGIACLRYAEDEVERCARRGTRQYVIVGAGFDTFALRRSDLDLCVFEVDHPDVQALKRQRIEQADSTPERLPELVPVDLESTSLGDALRASPFDPAAVTVFSCMNTLPYLSTAATRSMLAEISALAPLGSRVVLNYAARVPLTQAQQTYLARLRAVIGDAGEPQRSTWPPEDFEAALWNSGFRLVEHATEDDLARRYFEGRADGLRPGVPVRVVTAERTTTTAR
jgi:methyltransferase (TIGR00027 family)